MEVAISSVRNNFLNIQNKADFHASGLMLPTYIRYIMEDQNDLLDEDNKLIIMASKAKVIILWEIEGERKMMVMNKKSRNYVNDFNYDKYLAEKSGIRFGSKATAYGKSNVEFFVNLFKDLFTGKNWATISNVA